MRKTGNRKLVIGGLVAAGGMLVAAGLVLGAGLAKADSPAPVSAYSVDIARAW